MRKLCTHDMKICGLYSLPAADQRSLQKVITW